MITSDVHVAAVVKCVAEGADFRLHFGSALRLNEFCADAARLGLIEYRGDIEDCRITPRGRDLHERLLRRLPIGRANEWAATTTGGLMDEVRDELERLDREVRSD